jgi:hypothetical protein
MKMLLLNCSTFEGFGDFKTGIHQAVRLYDSELAGSGQTYKGNFGVQHIAVQQRSLTKLHC